MSLDLRTLRRRLAATALLALLALIAVSLTQCQQVQDNLLGVRLAPRGGAGSCISECAHMWADSMRAESDRHLAAVEACASDSVCLALEEIVHENAVQRVKAGRRSCQDQCHHQGGGQGGGQH